LAAFFIKMDRTLKLTAASTASMPRLIIFAVTCVYALSGLFGHDPWKNDDAVGFGTMWMVAHGNFHDFIFPHISGRDILIGPPLPYWLGGLSIHYLGPIIGEVNAARLMSGVFFLASTTAIWYSTYLLGRRKEVQPMAFALGGEPSPKEFGKTIADGSLLIFLACVGLAVRVHEASPLLTELFGLCILIYGIVRGFDKPFQGGAIGGLAIGIIALSGSLWTATLLGIPSLLSIFLLNPKKVSLQWVLPFLIISGLMLSIWPLAWKLGSASKEQIELAIFNWWGVYEFKGFIHLDSVEFLGINFWSYTWPVWPLFFWGVYVGFKNSSISWRMAHLYIPIFLFIAQIILLIFNQDLNERFLMLLIPPMAIISAFGLPYLRRGLISFIDWLSLLSFTILAGFIWTIWFAKLTGIPAVTANNVTRYIPGFVAHFEPIKLIIALIITTIWILIVRWRVSRSPKVIWRCLVISASGTTLMWVLLMTLWLPTINYAKTYEPVARRFAKVLPQTVNCVDSSYLGDAQLASFAYFTMLRLEDNSKCEFKLTHSSEEAKAAALLNHQRLTLIWEDRRDSDRDERLRLYRVTQQ